MELRECTSNSLFPPDLLCVLTSAEHNRNAEREAGVQSELQVSGQVEGSGEGP